MTNSKYIKSTNDGDTGISVNAGHSARIILVLASAHHAAGNDVYSAIYMLKFGFSDNNMTAITIAESKATSGYGAFIFTVSNSGTLVISSAALSDPLYLLISNKAF